MSLTAHIPSHRKPRRSASKLAVRAGVAGGVLGTLAMAGPASAAETTEPVTETIEMPVLDLSAVTASVTAALNKSAEATEQAALEQELTAREEAAREEAATFAKKAKAEAKKKAEAEARAEAEAEAKAKAAAERRAAAERAARSAARTTLTAPKNSTSTDGSSASGSTKSSTPKSSTAKTTSKATGSAAAIVNFALAQVGDSYVMGATGPNSWDCSGLVQAAYRQAGISLPRMSQGQSSAGTQVSLSNLKAGDILYWGGAGSAYHVAIYVGGGQFVGAQNSSTGVVKRSLDWDTPSGAVRVL
ncbi:C40 family peptidase [Streptomyces sp. NPDC006879]|uniref:C40 family peptidase n=1 Tax=Streptomyces sp. NPDC006879 TaxID=3364767 RepID=UPI0036C934D7